MAGKRSAKEVLDEWQAKMRANTPVDAGGSVVAAPIQATGRALSGAAQTAEKLQNQVQRIGADVGAEQQRVVRDLQAAGIAEKDIPYYLDMLKQQAAGAGHQVGAGALDAAGAALDIYDQVPGMMQEARNAMASQPSAYDQEMMGYDMQPNAQTEQYYKQMQQQAQRPMAEKAGAAVDGLLDSAGGAYDKLKGIGGQFMQGMQGGQPQQAAPQVDPAQIQQLLQSLSPEQKAALMQQLGGGM